MNFLQTIIQKEGKIYNSIIELRPLSTQMRRSSKSNSVISRSKMEEEAQQAVEKPKDIDLLADMMAKFQNTLMKKDKPREFDLRKKEIEQEALRQESER